VKGYWVISLLVFLILGTLLWDGFYRFLSPPPTANPRIRIIRIQAGTGLYAIARQLTQEEIIQDPYTFMMLAWWKGMGRKIQWGEFELASGMSPTTLLEDLTTGKNQLKRVTIPEGFTLQQIADRLSEDNLADKRSFLFSARDPRFLNQLGIGGASLEGYLFPDTYVFHRGMSSRDIQKKMVQRFKKIYNGLPDDSRIKEVLTEEEIVTLASIVEKESGLPDERPLIASVFYNRLKIGMALQSDPTVIYGIEHFNGDLTKKDLLTPTAYNTYLKPGLPPGPISNPGKNSLEAVLSPARSAYLYFVSRNDGSHYFSKNLTDHNRAVIRYQLSRKGDQTSGER
jgi:peptidoglycan lytic transglycosylase G